MQCEQRRDKGLTRDHRSMHPVSLDDATILDCIREGHRRGCEPRDITNEEPGAMLRQLSRRTEEGAAGRLRCRGFRRRHRPAKSVGVMSGGGSIVTTEALTRVIALISRVLPDAITKHCSATKSTVRSIASASGCSCR